MWLLKEAECVESLLQTLLALCFISRDIDPETLWIIYFLVVNDSEPGSAWEREIICSQWDSSQDWHIKTSKHEWKSNGEGGYNTGLQHSRQEKSLSP